MDENKKKTIIRELTLVLISLTGWEEDKRNAPGEKVFRAWKGYKFEHLDELQEQRLIYQIPGGKSLLLTDEGKQEVEQLKRKYFGKKED
jgi:hypothetical protein